MEKENKCSECRSWEEEMYWNHFQSAQFYQFLPTDFHHQLEIPVTFSKNLKKKLPEMVTLKGPSGSTWEVGLTTKSSVMFFTHGWFEFVVEHLLCEKDLLMFKFNGESQFDVLVFDGHTLCEKASTYFVRKCGHGENSNDCQAKRKTRESSVDDITVLPKTVIQDTPAEKTPSDDTDEVPLGIPTMEDGPDRRLRRKIDFMEPSIIRQNMRVEPPPGFHDFDAVAKCAKVVVRAMAAEEPANDDIDEIPLGVPIDVADRKKISHMVQSKRNEAPPIFLDVDAMTSSSSAERTANDDIDLIKGTARRRILRGTNLKNPSASKQRKGTKAPPGLLDADTVNASPKVSPAEETSNDDIEEIPSRVPIRQNMTGRGIWQKISLVELSAAKQREKMEAPPGFPEAAGSEPESLVPKVRYSSKKLMTEKEKKMDNAQRVARAAVTKEGFFVVMKPTNLSPKFFVVLPTDWLKKQIISPKKQNVILCFRDRFWRIQFSCTQAPLKTGGTVIRAFFCGGWRAFATDTKLKEYDVCVFEPETPANIPFRLNVNIIRCHLKPEDGSE